MLQALRLAIEIRSRQYGEFLQWCLLRPGAACAELLDRPEHWWPGAALVIMATAWKLGPSFVLILCPLIAVFTAWYCRARAGGFRWRTWAVGWGYCLLPALVALILFYSMLDGIWIMMKALMLMCGIGTFKANMPILNTIFCLVMRTGIILILTTSIFAVLRFMLTLVRAATRSSWAYALGITLLALLSGTVCTILAAISLNTHVGIGF